MLYRNQMYALVIHNSLSSLAGFFRQPIRGLQRKISQWGDWSCKSADGWTPPTILLTRFNVQLDNDSRLFSISRILTQVEVDPQLAEFNAPLTSSETLNKTIICSADGLQTNQEEKVKFNWHYCYNVYLGCSSTSDLRTSVRTAKLFSSSQ